MSSITSLLNTVKSFPFAHYSERSDQPNFLHLTNIYDNPEFRKRDLFIQNRNALGILTKFLTHKNCPVHSIIFKQFMLDDGTNDGLENYQTNNDFKVLMDAVKKNKSIEGLTFFGPLSNVHVKNICDILPRVSDDRHFLFLNFYTDSINDDQLEMVMEKLEFSSLESLYIVGNELHQKTGETLKKILPKLPHLRNFIFEDNEIFVNNQKFRNDFRIAVQNNISLTYVRTDLDHEDQMEYFMRNSMDNRNTREMKEKAVDTLRILKESVHCNRDIQTLYKIFKKNSGIRRMGLSDKQAPQSIRNPNKTRLPVELRRYIHEFIPTQLTNKGISTFIKWMDNLKSKIIEIRKKVDMEFPNKTAVQKKRYIKKEKIIYFQNNIQNIIQEEIDFILDLNEVYVDILLDKIYRYTRATGIYRKTKDGKPPVFRTLKLESVDEPEERPRKRRRT